MKDATLATILVVGFVFITGLVLILGALEDKSQKINPYSPVKVDMTVVPRGNPSSSN
jgi:Ca2+/H+ antiporter